MYPIYQLVVEQGWDQAAMSFRFDTHKILFQWATSAPSWRVIVDGLNIVMRVKQYVFETEKDYYAARSLTEEFENTFGNITSMGTVVEWFDYAEMAPMRERDPDDTMFYVYNSLGEQIGVTDPDADTIAASDDDDDEYELDSEEKEAIEHGEDLLNGEDEDDDEDSSESSDDSFIVHDSDEDDGDEDYVDNDDDDSEL